MTVLGQGGGPWGVVLLAMLAVLLVVVVRQLRRASGGSVRPAVVGVAIGLGVAGVCLAAVLLR